MCFFGGGGSQPAPVTQVFNSPVSAAPVRQSSGASASSARATALTARGVRDTIGTSALGDSGFGKNIKKATFLGATTGAY